MAALKFRSCGTRRYEPPVAYDQAHERTRGRALRLGASGRGALISKQSGSRRREAVQSIRHQIIVASQDALDVECRTGSRVGISIARADGPIDRYHLCRRNAGCLCARNLPASDLAAQSSRRRCIVRRWRRCVDPCRISRSSLCAARSRAKKAWDSSCPS